MKQDWSGGVRFAALAISLVFSVISSLPLTAQVSNSSSLSSASNGSSPIVAVLEYREVTNAVFVWGLSPRTQPTPFAKEPALAERKAKRGRLEIARSKGPGLGFIWDTDQGKLYLDLNENGDLTDDTNGVFAAWTSSRSGGQLLSQDFHDIRLRLQTRTGLYPMLLDLSLRDYSSLYVSGMLRSYYSGKVTLGGQDWQVGIIEKPYSEIGMLKDAALLLRPWSEQERSFNADGGDLQAFALPKTLFFKGVAHGVNPAWETRDGDRCCRLELVEQTVQLGDLQITGSHIQRIVLRDASRAAVLDVPGGNVRVPVGNYSSFNVHLQNDGQGASLKTGFLNRGLNRTISVQAEKPAVLAVGGPLTNTVTLNRRGSMLVLNHSVVGAGGDAYELDGGKDYEHPPKFAISQGDKQLATGKFEFG